MSAQGKIVRGAAPDPDLVALVRAIAKADAEDDVARRLAKRREEGRKAA